MKSKSTLKLSAVALACSMIFGQVANAEDVKIKAKDGGISFKSGDTQVKIGGRLMWDFDYYNDVHGDGSGTELRRGRFYIQSQSGDWKTKLQVNISDADAAKEGRADKDKFEDAYIEYKGFSFGSLKVGKFKEPFGLEELTSSKYISTIERTMMTNAFAPGRSYGIGLGGKADNMTWTVGVFDAGSSDDNQNNALTGRVTFNPIKSDDSLVHLGLAFSTRKLNNDTFSISERAEVHLAGNKVASSPSIAASDVNLVGVEAAFNTGSFSVQAEYQMADVSAFSSADEDAEFSGYYLMGSYFLTGESRPYKGGKFGKVKPKGDAGAWELVARYSFLDAEEEALNDGTETTNFTVGVNYYATTNVRVMFNYIDTEVETGSVTEDGDAISLRAQYIF